MRGVDGERIRTLRKTKNVSLEQLAAVAKVSPAMMSYIEQGARQPNSAILDTIALYLGVTMDSLMRPRPGDPKGPPPPQLTIN